MPTSPQYAAVATIVKLLRARDGINRRRQVDDSVLDMSNPFYSNDTASGAQRAVINASLNSVKEEEEEELEEGPEQTSGAQPGFASLTSNVSGGGATDSYMGFDMSASSSNHGSSYFSAQKCDDDEDFKAFSTRVVLDNLDASGISAVAFQGDHVYVGTPGGRLFLYLASGTRGRGIFSSTGGSDGSGGKENRAFSSHVSTYTVSKGSCQNNNCTAVSTCSCALWWASICARYALA